MRALTILTVALASSLLWSPAAQAGTVELDEDVFYGYKGTNEVTPVVRYAAGPGEVNALTAVPEGETLALADPAGIVAPAPCVTASATEVRCPIPGGTYNAEVQLGDGDDAVLLRSPSIGDAVVDGGEGDDRIEIDGFYGELSGGPGDDLLSDLEGAQAAGGLVDGVVATGGPGDDDLRYVAASYEDRSASVHVDLTAGEARLGGERDALTGVRVVFGGAGADALIGSGAREELFGRDGDDRIASADGEDDLDGGPGDDVLAGGGGPDWLRGEEGDDELDGEAGDDHVQGAEGADRLTGGPGADAVEPGGGGDVVLVDGDGIDAVVCEGVRSKAAVVSADGRDLVRRCGSVRRSAPAQVYVDAVGPDQNIGVSHRRAAVTLSCSQDAVRCRGRFGAALPGERPSSWTAFGLRAGESSRFVHGRLAPDLRAELVRCGELFVVYVVQGRDADGRRSVQHRATTQELRGRGRDPSGC